jgi:hypothetical protein
METDLDVEMLDAVSRQAVLLDSGQPGVAENAFRRIVLLCAKYDVRVCDAIAAAFGQDDRNTAQLEAQLRQREEDAAEIADALEEAQRTIAMLRRDEPEERVARAPGFKGWLSHVWRFPQFRLMLLAAVDMAGTVATQKVGEVAPLFWLVGLCLFVAWSIAEVRRNGFWKLLMKWMVYGSTSALGGIVLFFRADESVLAGPVLNALLAVKALALLLTLSRLSEFLADLVAAKVSPTIATVKSWF